jgi:hypothetical protein
MPGRSATARSAIESTRKEKCKDKDKETSPHHQSLRDLSSFWPPSKSLLFLLFSSVSSPFAVAVAFESWRDFWLKPPVRRRESDAVRERCGAYEIKKLAPVWDINIEVKDLRQAARGAVAKTHRHYPPYEHHWLRVFSRLPRPIVKA